MMSECRAIGRIVEGHKGRWAKSLTLPTVFLQSERAKPPPASRTKQTVVSGPGVRMLASSASRSSGCLTFSTAIG